MAILRALSGLLVCLGTCPAYCESPVPRLPRDQLLVHHDAQGRVVEGSTVEDWHKRRAEVVRGFESVAGTLPGDEKRCPFEMSVVEEVDCGSYVRRLIEYSSEPGCRTPAYLLVPKTLLVASGKKAPAVLCLHGTNNVVGHGVVVGLGNTPNRTYGVELAERGYVVFAPNYPLLARYQPDIVALGWKSGTLKAVWDNIRGMDLLSTLPYVDSTGFAAIGHSLGGHNSVYTAFFDDRIKVIVSSCGLDSYMDYYGGLDRYWEPGQGWTQLRYLPKLADYKGRLVEIPYDFHELIAGLAPRRTVIIAPLHDGNFKHDSVDRVAAAARPIFALTGAPQALTVVHPDCEHDFPPEMRELGYEAIDEVLRPTKAKTP